MRFLKKLAKRLGAKRVLDWLGKLKQSVSEYGRRAYDKIFWQRKLLSISKKTGSTRLHLGCGGNHIQGMVNCEFRCTPAADIVMDCSDLSRFKNESVDHIFSHAFFEHLYFDQRPKLLADCRRVLKQNGTVLFLGLPDLNIIAKAYLERAELAPGWAFDAYMVYRYTHGSPEIASGWWLEQLHKTLFDRDVIKSLLKDAGFDHWILFNYRFVGEDIPLNLGFIAWHGDMGKIDIEQLLRPHYDKIASLNEVMDTLEQN